jgi:hypothetical protein
MRSSVEELKDPEKLSKAARSAVLDSLLQQRIKNDPSLLNQKIPQQQQQQQQKSYNYSKQGGKRGENFVLTRILLRLSALLCEAGELTAEQKAQMKTLVVSGDEALFRAAKSFDQRRDLAVFRDTLQGLLVAF